MITELTKEQELLVDEARERWLNKLFKYECYHNYDNEKATKAIQKIYEYAGLSKPKVEICSSPYEILTKSKEYGIDNVVLSYYIDISDFGWCSFYQFFVENFDFVKGELLEKFNDIVNAVHHSFLSAQYEEVCFVSKFPVFISRDERNNLHNTKEAAIRFEDGYGQHYVHGRFLDKELFEKAQDFDNLRKMFYEESNEDVKAAFITMAQENYGADGLMDILDAKKVDEITLNHRPDYTEIIERYESKKKFPFLSNSKQEVGNYPYVWIKYTCPSTKSIYLIDSFYDLNLEEAVKFHRPAGVPLSLDYQWPVFSN